MTTSTLKRIRVKAIRSFEQASEVTFPERGLVLLRGINHDTGGASGSGKSSLLLAVAQAFGYCPFPATAMQSWLTDEPFEVSVDFGAFEDGKPVEASIHRGARTKLMLNGAAIKGSVAVVEKKLETLLGLQPELLEALTYRGQKQRSLFLSMTDADKKDFLSKVLGLEVFEKAADEATAKAKTIDAELKIKLAGVNQLRIVRDETISRLIDDEQEDLRQLEKMKLASADVLERAREQLEAAKVDVFNRQTAAVEVAKGVEASFADEEAAAQAALAAVDLFATEILNEGAWAASNSMLQECQRRRAALEAADAEKVKAQAAELRLLEQRRYSALSFQKMKPAVLATIAKATKDLESLLACACPTCKQSWKSDQAVEVAQVQISTAEAQLHDIEKKLAEAVEIEAEIAAMVPVVADPLVARMKDAERQLQEQVAAERAAERSRVEAHESVQRTRRAEARQALSEVRARKSEAAALQAGEALEEVNRAQGRLAVANQLVGSTSADLREIEKQLAEKQALNRQRALLAQTTRDNLKTAEERLAKAELDVRPLEVAFAEESDFAQLVGREGFLGAIFDEVLAEISDGANKILAAVPNTSSVSIRFRTESFTVKGATKRSIVPVVTISGHEAPMKSGLSGGMETAAELAVDLAIVDVVSRRTGQVPGWLILDESFTGLGLIEKECCLEILEKFAQDRLVIVVDHDNQFKEMFSDTITVERRNDRSYIKQGPPVTLE